MEELLIPNPAKKDVATYDILVEGKAVDPTYKLLSMSIIKEVNRVSMAKLVFSDGDASDRNFAISNTDDFKPGNKIQINIGRDTQNAQAFKGIIIRHGVRVKNNGNSQLLVECQDECVKMTISRHSHYYEKVKDSQVFDELIEKYKLTPDTEDTGLTHKELVQHHISDWDFMVLRAEANGMLVHVQDGTLRVAKPVIGSKEKLQVNYGSSILEFESEMDARSQYSNVNARSWDYANQQLFTADSSSTSFAEAGNIPGSDIADKIIPGDFEMHHSGHKLEQELQEWADGLLLRSRLAKIRGRAKCIGFGDLQPGDTIKITGVGDRFNGMTYVTAVRQDIGAGIWETQIQFGMDPDRYAYLHRDLVDPPSAGLLGSIHGLQIGVAVKLQDDPDGQDRIQVRIPVIDDKAEGIWTRVACLDAGQDRGSFFRPEIGDEVIVGFINDDPRDAVILGMLNSSKKPAPITAQDANDEKGFTTRSKMHVSFNDKTKTITIDTPAGNSITLDEQGMKIEIVDQNQNKLTMQPSGISLESQLNIDIKAGTVLTLSAGASLSIGAPSLSMQADADLSLSGATANFAAQGPNVISGMPVKIN